MRFILRTIFVSILALLAVAACSPETIDTVIAEPAPVQETQNSDSSPILVESDVKPQFYDSFATW